MSEQNIPVIDIKSLYGSDKPEIVRTAPLIGDAFRGIGFFCVTGHGLSLEDVAACCGGPMTPVYRRRTGLSVRKAANVIRSRSSLIPTRTRSSNACQPAADQATRRAIPRFAEMTAC